MSPVCYYFVIGLNYVLMLFFVDDKNRQKHATVPKILSDKKEFYSLSAAAWEVCFEQRDGKERFLLQVNLLQGK